MTQQVKTAGLLRRLGAMLYDALAVIALLMAGTALLMTLTGGEAITAQRVGVWVHVYQAALIAIVVLFFGVFWTRKGQTLGMTAWRLKIERLDGALPTWRDALLRLAGALISLVALGLGYLWIWIDREQRAWHDRWSGTRVVVVPKR
jgi:uncharacterized RDD family membrane protein YckC